MWTTVTLDPDVEEIVRNRMRARHVSFEQALPWLEPMDDRTLKILELVGRNMRAERVRSGLTQEELAHMVDTSTTQIARMERGETDTGISKCLFAMEALGASPEALFVGFTQ